MGGFVYKQRYAQAGRVPATSIPGLNVRHVLYIATRPGAVYNPGCGFSLWGCLQERASPENIQNLDRAKLRQRSPQPSKDRSKEARRDASQKQSLAQSPEF